LLIFQQLDVDRDSGSEEMQVSSIDSLLEISEIVSLIFTLTFSAVIVKLSNFGDAFFYITHTVLKRNLKEACSLHEKDGIYVGMGVVHSVIQKWRNYSIIIIIEFNIDRNIDI
jgi:hypothetical protein